MRRRMLADPPGRITPGAVFLVLGVALVAWYVAFTETSPTALGTPVADLADTAFRFSENLFKGAKPARQRRIIDVPAADRLTHRRARGGPITRHHRPGRAGRRGPCLPAGDGRRQAPRRHGRYGARS